LAAAILGAVEFEWDPEKSESNLRHHGVSFEEAATVFDDALSITVPDPDHSFDEERFVIVGVSHEGRLLIVSHAERATISESSAREN